MGVMSPASGRETEKMVARGSSSNTRVASDSRNEADAARTSGRRAGADGEDEDDADASPSGAGSGCIRSYRWPWRSAGRRSMFMEASRRGTGRTGLVRSGWTANSPGLYTDLVGVLRGAGMGRQERRGGTRKGRQNSRLDFRIG